MAFLFHSVIHSSNICFVRLCTNPRLGHEDKLENSPSVVHALMEITLRWKWKKNPTQTGPSKNANDRLWLRTWDLELAGCCWASFLTSLLLGSLRSENETSVVLGTVGYQPKIHRPFFFTNWTLTLLQGSFLSYMAQVTQGKLRLPPAVQGMAFPWPFFPLCHMLVPEPVTVAREIQASNRQALSPRPLPGFRGRVNSVQSSWREHLLGARHYVPRTFITR